MNDFKALWQKTAGLSLLVSVMSAVFGSVTGSGVAWGISLGILPGIIDVIGLGLRLPLWAKLNQGSAILSINLRLMSRLLVLAVFFYGLKKFTRVNIDWAVLGLVIPYAIYIAWAIWQHKGKGVDG